VVDRGGMPDDSPDELGGLVRSVAHEREPERALGALTELRGRLDALEAKLVGEAVTGGASWARIGKALGVSRQAAHRRHAARLARESPPAPPELMITRRARQTVEYARAEARGLRSRDVRLEHLLLGLMRDPRSPAAEALADLDVSLPAAREAVERAYSAGTVERPLRAVAPPPGGRLPVSAEGRRAFEQALREAVALGHSYLGAEHLLLALLRFDGGAPGAVLAELGVSPDGVERSVRQLQS
jgi:hypothetical protein